MEQEHPAKTTIRAALITVHSITERMGPMPFGYHLEISDDFLDHSITITVHGPSNVRRSNSIDVLTIRDFHDGAAALVRSAVEYCLIECLIAQCAWRKNDVPH